MAEKKSLVINRKESVEDPYAIYRHEYAPLGGYHIDNYSSALRGTPRGSALEWVASKNLPPNIRKALTLLADNGIPKEEVAQVLLDYASFPEIDEVGRTGAWSQLVRPRNNRKSAIPQITVPALNTDSIPSVGDATLRIDSIPSIPMGSLRMDSIPGDSVPRMAVDSMRIDSIPRMDSVRVDSIPGVRVEMVNPQAAQEAPTVSTAKEVVSSTKEKASEAKPKALGLVDWMYANGFGKMAKFSERERIFKDLGLGSDYKGTAEQNMKLLAALKKVSADREMRLRDKELSRELLPLDTQRAFVKVTKPLIPKSIK